jgi:hypothetical protein
MNQTLSTFMKVTFTVFVLSVLIIGKCYTELKAKNEDYHSKISNYQIRTK